MWKRIEKPAVPIPHWQDLEFKSYKIQLYKATDGVVATWYDRMGNQHHYLAPWETFLDSLIVLIKGDDMIIGGLPYGD